MYKKNGKWAYWKIKEEDIQPILTMYQFEGMSAKAIGKIVGSCESTIIKVLRDYNVPVRTENKMRKFSNGYSINEDAFSDIDDPRAAYFFGWLLTDGWVVVNKHMVGIEVGTVDVQVLENLKDYLDTDKNKIRTRTRTDKRTGGISTVSSFKFSHEPIFKRLEVLGLKPNKSLKEKVHDSLKDSRHFWRGVLEGDGHVAANYTKLYVCGSLELCEKWVEFVRKIDPKVRSVIYAHKAPLYYAYTTDRVSAKLILDYLYDGVDESLRLERKYNAYLERYCDNSSNRCTEDNFS